MIYKTPQKGYNRQEKGDIPSALNGPAQHWLGNLCSSNDIAANLSLEVDVNRCWMNDSLPPIKVKADGN